MRLILTGLLIASTALVAQGSLKTWDGRHDIDQIDISVVYFVPRDRKPLPDWRERVDYFCRRIELFHRREFQGQSALRTIVQSEPFVSERSTAQLRQRDANFIFYQTLSEVDARLEFAKGERTAFPILLVLSDINWRPLDDFYRLRPQDDRLVFEGNYKNGEHFPGAASGGARATYNASRGVGWGLVSADGWRVPYRGSDCVVYHEGCGHTVGLPHPEPADGSVMSLAQYRGWINESWLEKSQKNRLGWEPKEISEDPEVELFTHFRAIPVPRVPRPGQSVALDLNWPEGVRVESMRVRLQTDLAGPWMDVSTLPVTHAEDPANAGPPATVSLGAFDRPTPVSYRVDAELKNGAQAELWGYFQVRAQESANPQPFAVADELVRSKSADGPALQSPPREEVDLLKLADPKNCWMRGEWLLDQGRLESPKQFGARIELPYEPPTEYRLTIIAEPLDQPNGLILGQRLGGRRFLALLDYTPGDVALSALENVDGRNVGNSTTYRGPVFRKNRLAQIIVSARRDSVAVTVDGRTIIDSRGAPDRFSLSDYWKTARDNALFLGTYNCRYRFYRVSIESLSGTGNVLRGRAAASPVQGHDDDGRSRGNGEQ